MKITKHILSFAAAAGLLAACQTPEIVQIASPENVIPASLHELEVDEIAISATNQQETVTFAWEAADYGAPTQINYSLEVALDETSPKVSLASGTATEVTLTYEDLNRTLFNDLQVPEGQPTELKFFVGSVLYAGSSIASYPKVYSEPISLTVTVTAAEKVYPKLTVAGSYAYNSWTPGKGQYVFDFDGNDAKYSGMIYFGEDVSALQFKFVGEAWGTNEFSVPEGTAQGAEASELPLQAGGGDNISAYATYKYYNLTLDKATPKVIKNFAFNSLGIIGSATPTGWDSDTDMLFDPVKQRFYVDITLTDGEFKFRADDGWDANWGADAFGVTVSNSDGNLEAKAGNYRVYVNMNNPAAMTYELNKGDYGAAAPEPEPEPEPEVPAVVGWSLIGAFNDWGADLMLASDGTYFHVKGVELNGELKFRKDGDWGVNFGLAEGAEFAANAEIAVAGNGANINVPAGTYDVYLDEANAKAWFITDGSYPGGAVAPEASEWGVVGVVNNWGGTPDIVMYKTATEGLFVAKNVAMPDGGFKIRANNAWVDTANYGLASAGAVEVDHAYDLVCSGGSGDMTLVAGNYDIWFDLTNKKVYIMTPGKPISEAVGGEVVVPDPSEQAWYMVGNFNNWNPADEAYKMTAEAEYFVFKNFVAAEGCEAKFAPGAWNGDKGIDGAFAANTACNTGSGNIPVAAGTYDVYLAKDLSKFYFMTAGYTPGQTPSTPDPEPDPTPDPTPDPEPGLVASEWGIVGVVNGWNAPDVTMYKTETEGLFVAYKVDMPAGGFKIRANGVWNDAANYGLAAAGNVEVDHVYDVITGSGSGDMTVAAGTYDIWFDLTNKKVYIMTPDKPITEAVGYEATTPDPTPDPQEGNKIYLKPNANWKNDNARFALYTWDGGDQWFDLKDTDGDGIYEVTLPTSISNIIFCRMNPGTSANNWTNKWNQTSDLKVPTDGKNMYTVKEGTWDNGGGTWSTK